MEGGYAVGDLLAAALRHAAAGHLVFPLAASKRPVANCDRCRDADHDRGRCARGWRLRGRTTLDASPHRPPVRVGRSPS